METQQPLVEPHKVPWENEKMPGILGFFRTLAEGFRPLTSSPSMRGDSIHLALQFALLTTLPLALFEGIIPYTRTLQFGPSFRITTLGGHTDVRLVVLDIARSMGLSLMFSLVLIAALAAPYVSLARAYNAGIEPNAPLRVVLYRSWLIPASSLVFNLLLWAMPLQAGQSGILIGLCVSWIPIILFISAIRHVAQRICGIGPLPSLAVVLVPVVLFVLSAQLLEPIKMRVSPPPPPQSVPNKDRVPKSSPKEEHELMDSGDII